MQSDDPKIPTAADTSAGGSPNDWIAQPEYETVNNPIHRAVWDQDLPIELFESRDAETSDAARQVMERSLHVVRYHRDGGSLLGDDGKTADAVLRELGNVGYWGLRVDEQFGGSGVSFRCFVSFLTRMTTVCPAIAGLASAHGCIGAAGLLQAFGSEQQRRRLLPELAKGERLSAFALTEPCAGTDLTALRTRGVLDGDSYVVNGEKLFVTNAVPGSTIALVCLIDNAPAVLICELPLQETANCFFREYDLWALRRTHNRGIVYRGFRVPANNLLRPRRGNGLTIAYHGLNLGRVALCASAAGNMRRMLASMIPWARYRVTYGEPIARRQLVRRRLSRLAGMIVACDALAAWCARLIDEGYRGELECIVAKTFGSEAQKEAAVDLCMKTHGGRAFLHGHLFGDNVFEFLAPCIYEGESEVLGLAFMRSLLKHRTTQPCQRSRPLDKLAPPHIPEDLRGHAEYANGGLRDARTELVELTGRHQAEMGTHQCRMAELSRRLQTLVVLLVTSLYASRVGDDVDRLAADIICQDLRRQLDGSRPTDRYFRSVDQLGEAIVDGGFRAIRGIDAGEILLPYET